MTTTRDPHHPAYRNEADVRGELTRVFGECESCRRCVDLCPVFPTLFDLLGRFEDADAGRLTPLEQDRVVDQCSQCGLCVLDCPRRPGRSDANVDVPRTMRRAEAMRRAAGHHTWRRRVADRVLARTARFGRSGRRVARWRPGSAQRRLLAALTGISAGRRLPPVPAQRFSAWFRQGPGADDRAGDVLLVPGCLVEHHDPQAGRDVVVALASDGVACTLVDLGCCGAPHLESGDVDRFRRVADRNIRMLAARLRDGYERLVVPEPLCARVLREDYPDHCGPHLADDAGFVARCTVDADVTVGTSPDAGVVRVRSGHRTTDPPGGDRVVEVRRCPGTGTAWGLRAENEDAADELAARLAERVASAAEVGSVVVADETLTRVELAARLGRPVVHPVAAATAHRPGSRPY